MPKVILVLLLTLLLVVLQFAHQGYVHPLEPVFFAVFVSILVSRTS